jgi:hypothetical protein
MRTIMVGVSTVDLAKRMAEMRLWLDEHRCEPSIFTYSEEGTDVSIRVAFKIADEAAAFSVQFNGGAVELTDAEHVQAAQIGEVERFVSGVAAAGADLGTVE